MKTENLRIKKNISLNFYGHHRFWNSLMHQKSLICKNGTRHKKYKKMKFPKSKILTFEKIGSVSDAVFDAHSEFPYTKTIG